MKIMNIPIKNIYYMLSYAYQSLKFEDYMCIDSEDFEHLSELYAEILILSTNKLLQQGLYKTYTEQSEDGYVVRGKIDITNSLKMNNVNNNKLAMTYDHLTEDNLYNQIIKTTLLSLVYSQKIKPGQTRSIKNILLYLSNVTPIEITYNTFNQLMHNNQKINYLLPIDICRQLYEQQLINANDNNTTALAIKDEQLLSSLFERFIYRFYEKETNFIVSRPKIYWDTTTPFTDALPDMQTDIVLRNHNKTMIIDTKFYNQNMAVNRYSDSRKQISSNMYQLFTYLENYKVAENEQLSGMLLYAKTEDDVQPDHIYEIKGKVIQITNIDLSCNFNHIFNDLLSKNTILYHNIDK